MPRKDPMTGCMVMTHGEFYAKEAERNGTSPAEEFTNDFVDMQLMFEDDANIEKTRLSDLSEALRQLNAGIDWFNEGMDAEDQVKKPSAIVKVYDIEAGESYSSSSLKFKVLTDDGRNLSYSSQETRGTYWEPPDGEIIIEEIGK